MELLAREIVNSKLRISANVAARTHKNDIRPIAEISDKVGLASAPSQVVEFSNKPPRLAGQIVKDEGDGGTKIAEFLASQKIV